MTFFYPTEFKLYVLGKSIDKFMHSHIDFNYQHARELISARKTSHNLEDVPLVEVMYLVFTRMPC